MAGLQFLFGIPIVIGGIIDKIYRVCYSVKKDIHTM